MPPLAHESSPRSDRKVVEELVGLNLKIQGFGEEIKGLRDSIRELADFMSGGKTPEAGLLLQVFGLKGAVERLQEQFTTLKTAMEEDHDRNSEIFYGSKPGESDGIVAKVRDGEKYMAWNRKVLWTVVVAVLSTITAIAVKWIVFREK